MSGHRLPDHNFLKGPLFCNGNVLPHPKTRAMYKILFFITSFLLTTVLLPAQQAQRVVRIGVDLYFSDTENETLSSENTISSASGTSARFLLNTGTGTLKDGKRLIFYGLITGYDHSTARDASDHKSKTNKYTIGAMAGRQIFLEMTPRFYYTNNMGLFFEFSRARNTSDLQPGKDLITEQYFAHFDLRPIGVSFRVNPRLMTCANFGNLRAGYLRTVEWRENAEVDVKAKDRTFSVELNPHFISFGVFFFLNDKTQPKELSNN